MNDLNESPGFQSPTKAYSYYRYSTPEQAKGDSLRRQVSASETWAKEHGMVLDNTLRIDAGVSAFHGRNATEGALGEFLKEIKNGNVQKGSYLLVESLDRLSRQVITEAISLFLQILAAGIHIVTLIDKQVFSEQSVNQNPNSLFMTLGIMIRANEESETKSIRLKESWKEKRKNLHKQKLTSLGPQWLKLSSDRTAFEIVKERATIVREMFASVLDGIGQFSIAKRLNEQKIECWGRGKAKAHYWRQSTIRAILVNQAVTGFFQPHMRVGRRSEPVGDPIFDYYPAIIDQEVFDKVQAILNGNHKWKSTHNPRFNSLFSGLAVCAYNDEACVYQGGVLNGPRKGQPAYFKPYLTRFEGENEIEKRAMAWPYEEFELLFLKTVGGLDYRTIFGVGNSEIVQCDRTAASAEAALKAAQSAKKNLLNALESTSEPDTVKTILGRLKEREDSLRVLENAFKDAQAALEHARNADKDAIFAGESIKRLLNDRQNPKVRMALRREIRRIVKIIRVNFRVRGEDFEPWFEIEFSNGVRRFSFAPDMVVESNDDCAALLTNASATPLGPAVESAENVEHVIDEILSGFDERARSVIALLRDGKSYEDAGKAMGIPWFDAYELGRDTLLKLREKVRARGLGRYWLRFCRSIPYLRKDYGNKPTDPLSA